MKKIVRLTENDLVRLVNRVINEQSIPNPSDQHSKCWTELIPVDKDKNPLFDIFKQGYKPTSENWQKEIEELGNHISVFKTSLDKNNTIDLLKKCNPSATYVFTTTLETKKGNQYITLIGMDN